MHCLDFMKNRERNQLCGVVGTRDVWAESRSIECGESLALAKGDTLMKRTVEIASNLI